MNNRWYHATLKEHNDTFKNGWIKTVFIRKSANGYVTVFDGYRLRNTITVEKAREMFVLGKVAESQQQINDNYIDLVMF